MIDFIGGRTRTRTWDPLIKSQLLYQLSYAPGKCRPGRPRGLRPVAKRVPTVQGRPAMDRFAMASARPGESRDPLLGAGFPLCAGMNGVLGDATNHITLRARRSAHWRSHK